jgi:hypothetical protein
MYTILQLMCGFVLPVVQGKRQYSTPVVPLYNSCRLQLSCYGPMHSCCSKNSQLCRLLLDRNKTCVSCWKPVRKLHLKLSTA